MSDHFELYALLPQSAKPSIFMPVDVEHAAMLWLIENDWSIESWPGKGYRLRYLIDSDMHEPVERTVLLDALSEAVRQQVRRIQERKGVHT